MKKYLIFALRLAFYISVLLFFPDDILIIPAVLLISYLFLENKYYSILPLALAFFIPSVYKILLITSYVIHLLLSHFIRKNRIYAFISYVLSILCINTVLIIMKKYYLDTLYISIVSLIIYAVINMLYIYHKKGIKSYTIGINDTLIHLSILLGYLFLTIIYSPNPLIFYLLFIQLFFLDKRIYSFIFFLLGISIWGISYKALNLDFLSYLSASYIPLVLLFELDYSQYQSIFFILYVILSLITLIKEKEILAQNNYAENLFNGFKNYLTELNNEYERLSTLKELKQNQLESIQNTYCKYCTQDTECKNKLDKRYSFLSNAVNHNDSNIYYCPHYTQFYLDTNIETRQKLLSYNAFSELSIELEYLYNQGIKRSLEYNKLIKDLLFFGYEVIGINIFLRNKTLFFNLNISNKKRIIPELILGLAHKRFKEDIDIKIIENKNYQELYIYKKPRVKIEYSHQVLAKNNNGISGDNYFIKREYNDSYIFALSDGMGSGHNAYLESAQALDLIKRLLEYNFSLKTTLKLLENMYELKSEYESYATLDVLFINTANMKLNLYKMGSTSTYIIHNNEILSYENKSLPYKLDDINSSYEIEFFRGDTIILASDGISDFITKREIGAIDYKRTSIEIMNSILDKIKQKENNELKDDASLIVIKII